MSEAGWRLDPTTEIDFDLPCLTCGYNLRGLRGDPVCCPECGSNNSRLELLRVRVAAAAWEPRLITRVRAFSFWCVPFLLVVSVAVADRRGFFDHPLGLLLLILTLPVPLSAHTAVLCIARMPRVVPAAVSFAVGALAAGCLVLLGTTVTIWGPPFAAHVCGDMGDASPWLYLLSFALGVMIVLLGWSPAKATAAKLAPTIPRVAQEFALREWRDRLV